MRCPYPPTAPSGIPLPEPKKTLPRLERCFEQPERACDVESLFILLRALYTVSGGRLLQTGRSDIRLKRAKHLARG